VALANETARSGFGALVFCSSRLGCERDAILISQVLPKVEEIEPWVMEKRINLLNDLRSSATGLDSSLEKTVPFGVAFHRALLPSPR
jgi:replicative superfamily II helicase